MPEYDNTDNPTQQPLIDRDDREIALEPFEGILTPALSSDSTSRCCEGLDTQMFKGEPVMEAT